MLVLCRWHCRTSSSPVRARTSSRASLLYGGLISYFFAFVTPRRLKQTWQRAEHASYLSRTAERDAEERGQKAADDLFDATSRSVGNALTVVALRPVPDTGFLIVQAATERALLNLTIVLRDNLIGRAVATGAAIVGTVDDSEREISDRLKRFGSKVLVAPIASETHRWGAVMVVQRRGSLFPEDDLLLLARLGRYAGTALDHALLISERRDRERRAADRRLREVESRLALMLDSIKDYAMLIIDDGGRVVSWQSGAEHVFGYTRAEMEDEPAAALYNIEAAEFAALLEDARRRGFADREGWCRRRDGARFIGATVIRPLTGEPDAPHGFVAVTRDVTAHRDLEDRLRQSQKMEAIGQLAGGIAHDFNNQLTAILGYSEVLSRDLAPDDGRRQSVSQIEKAAERAAGLTRQLLAFSRRQLIEPVVINLAQLVNDLLPMLRRVIGEHIQIQHDDGRSLNIRGDRSQVEQIIVNLAVNARDAMPEGGQLTIRTSNAWLDAAAAGRDVAPGPYVRLEVVDTGIGMDPATKARIFEPFFTTKEFGRGTGLGLATVYGIVQQMGGLVRVASQAGSGSTFEFFFPEAQAHETAVIKAPVPDLPRGDQTLLLVEDESSVRTLLQDTLERHGYHVIAAEHQAAALALVRARVDPIDLVITDVVMPGGTGPELVQALEAIMPGVPTLYISGFADPVLGQHGFPKASHFLQKPFSAGDLLLRVNQILTG